MKFGYPAQEDWNWFDNLPEDLKQSVLRLCNSNNPSAIYHYGYHLGYQTGYRKAMKKLKELVIAEEHRK